MLFQYLKFPPFQSRVLKFGFPRPFTFLSGERTFVFASAFPSRESPEKGHHQHWPTSRSMMAAGYDDLDADASFCASYSSFSIPVLFFIRSLPPYGRTN